MLASMYEGNVAVISANNPASNVEKGLGMWHYTPWLASFSID